MKTHGTLIFLACFVLSSITAAQNARSIATPVDLNGVFEAFKHYPELTSLEKKALVGRWYSGRLVVGAVQRDDAKHSVRLMGRVLTTSLENEILYFGIVSFETTDVAKAALLKKGSEIKVTGRLDRISKRDEPRPDAEWWEFVDSTIDEVIWTY